MTASVMFKSTDDDREAQARIVYDVAGSVFIRGGMASSVHWVFLATSSLFGTKRLEYDNPQVEACPRPQSIPSLPIPPADHARHPAAKAV